MSKRMVSLVLAGVLVLGAAGFAGAASRLIVYTSMKESLIGQLREAFIKQNPGLDMDYQSAGAGKLMAKIAAELQTDGRAVLASRANEIDFTAEGGMRGRVVRCAYLGEIIDYRVEVGGQEVRVQKGRRTAGPREGESCGLIFTRPTWYAGEDKSS